MTNESMPGSSEYARELAEALAAAGEDGMDGLGPTDAGICAVALRFHASRWRRRAVIAAAFAFVTALGVGSPLAGRHASASPINFDGTKHWK